MLESEVKARRHHNNKGFRQIKNGKTRRQAKYLKQKYCKPTKAIRQEESDDGGT